MHSTVLPGSGQIPLPSVLVNDEDLIVNICWIDRIAKISS